MKRYFNTSGPNNPAEHYTLPREALVEKGLDLVRKKRYFTIWAPRQTGKSTYFLLLREALQQAGYVVVHLNIENFLDASLPTFFRSLQFNFAQEGIALGELQNFGDLSNFLQNKTDIRLVLIIDEIEGLNPELFGQFLHTLRNLYHSRESHCLKSALLVGVSNIVGVVEDHASPFNIADNIHVPYFTDQETRDLLGQHEAETGQRFEEKVVAKISEITANQPGLVNGFAKELVERYADLPLITYEHYLEVEDWYLHEAIDKNIANIVSKARKYRPFVEELLYRDAKIPFRIDRESIRVLYVNGIIDRDEAGNVVFKVPLYRKRLHDAFYPYLNGETHRLARSFGSIHFFFHEDGGIDFDKLIAEYKAYVQRRSFKYFREKDEQGNYVSIKEAALVYSFETYIQAFLQEAGGKSYLEAHAGMGRTDLIIYLDDHEYVIEFKVYYGMRKFREGKRQLAYYCKKMGLDAGIYVVFVVNGIPMPESLKEDKETIEGVALTTYLIMYDEEKDF